MSVRVEVDTDSGRYWIPFHSHEDVVLHEGEEWSDMECDCHCPGCGVERLEHGCFPCACGIELEGLFERCEICHPAGLIWPGTIDTSGLCPDCHREDCDS